MLELFHFSKNWGILLVVGALVLIMVGEFWFYSKKKTEPEEEILRPPAVAGTFYPANKSELEEMVDGFLKAVEATKSAELKPRILIVPHAGYQYSGQVAAYSFAEVRDENFSTVVIIGSSHRVPFSGAAVYKPGSWETPLGQVKIDTELAKKLVNFSSSIAFNSEVHREEHSLEVEVPFLQKVLPNFKIVPILMSQPSEQVVETLADALFRSIDSRTLVVISSDLSHYLPYEEAVEVDRQTIDSILNGSGENLDACGAEAIKVGMKLAEKLGIGNIKLLKYANSGDVSGDHSRVVGYAAIGFYSPWSAQKELLEIARSTLESYIRDRRIPKVEVKEPELNEKLGAFVTLRKNGQLRGCIGRFESDTPLWRVVQEMAIAAATKDSRFSPVRPEELDEIKIEISVLSPLQKITDPSQIELGKHGVQIQKENRRGVFLPQVADDTGWDFEAFMGQLCSQKAGLPWDCWKDPSVEILTFTTEVFEE